MVIERAELPVIAGCEDAFAAAMEQGLALLADADGCHSALIGRGVENPSTFILLLRWDTVEAHMDFTRTAGFARFRDLIGPFVAGPSSLAHFTILGETAG